MAYKFAKHATDSGLDSYLKPVRSYTALETMDYTDFTAYDPDSKLSISESEISMTAVSGTYVYHTTKDYGAGYFSPGRVAGRCWRVHVKSVNSATTARTAFWGLSNVASDVISLQDANEHAIFLVMDTNGSAQVLSPQETYNGTLSYPFDPLSISTNTDYWVEIEIDPYTGTYGTLHVRVYTDSSYTNLYRSASGALRAATTWRYLHAATARTYTAATFSVVYKDMTFGIAVNSLQIPTVTHTFSIFARFRAADITQAHTLLYLQLAGTKNYRLVAAGNVAGDPIRWTSYDGGSDLTAATATGYIADTWHSVIACRNESQNPNLAVSIDGSTFGTKNKVSTSGAPSYLTISSAGTYRAIDGDVAEVAIWNMSMNLAQYAADVAALAKGISPATIRPANLLHYWDLTRNLTDRVGGCTLTAYNTPTVSEHPRVIP